MRGGGAGARDVPAIPEFMSLLTEHFNIEDDHPLNWTLMVTLVMFRAAYDDEVISMTKEQLPKGTQFISVNNLAGSKCINCNEIMGLKA